MLVYYTEDSTFGYAPLRLLTSAVETVSVAQIRQELEKPEHAVPGLARIKTEVVASAAGDSGTVATPLKTSQPAGTGGEQEQDDKASRRRFAGEAGSMQGGNTDLSSPRILKMCMGGGSGRSRKA